MSPNTITTTEQLVDWLVAEGHLREDDLVGSTVVACSRGGED